MTTYPYLNTRYTLPELCRLKGVNIETVYPKLKKAGKDADAVDIINLVAARVRFTWKGIAESMGIDVPAFEYRVKVNGLEKALLMGGLTKKISTWDRPLPEIDSDHETKNLIKSLQALGFEGETLEAELMKRVIT